MEISLVILGGLLHCTSSVGETACAILSSQLVQDLICTAGVQVEKSIARSGCAGGKKYAPTSSSDVGNDAGAGTSSAHCSSDQGIIATKKSVKKICLKFC